MTMGLNGLNNRPWWGAKREKLSVQSFVFAIATKRSVANCFDRSWAYFLVRFWGFEARTKSKYTMDDFFTLTIREPWLLKRKVSTSTISTWLAGKGLMLQDHRNWRHEAKPIGLSKRALWGKGRLIKEFPNLLYARWLQVGTSKNNLAHTFTYFANFGFWQLTVLKVQYFSNWTRCICLCSMVLMMRVKMARLPICVSDWKCNQW
jgi:hypothetical protein